MPGRMANLLRAVKLESPTLYQLTPGLNDDMTIKWLQTNTYLG